MEAFAYQNKPENVIKASSGAAFQRIVESVVDGVDSYSVYGAVWTDDFNVEHRYINDIKDIGVFSGSKYLRSSYASVLPNIKDDLLGGKTVVFSGTPCAVSSIIKFSEKEKLPIVNLYTIEIICHGTPEERAWKDCILWTENKFHAKVKNVNFRDKRVGWKYYPTSYAFDNGKEIIATYEAQLYIRLFMSSLVTSKGCFKCPFANMNRNADITIGDFWGVEEVFPDFPVNKGVSLVLANSEKGISVVDQISHSLQEDEHFRKCMDDSFLKYQHNLNGPTNKPHNYDQFWQDYNEYGFDYIIKKYDFYTMYKKMRFLARTVLNRIKGNM